MKIYPSEVHHILWYRDHNEVEIILHNGTTIHFYSFHDAPAYIVAYCMRNHPNVVNRGCNEWTYFFRLELLK